MLFSGLGPRLVLAGFGSGCFWGCFELAKDVYRAAVEASDQDEDEPFPASSRSRHLVRTYTR